MKLNIFFLYLAVFACAFMCHAEDATVSGSPSVITTTTTKIQKQDGTVTTINTSSSKLLAVQKSTTTIVKSGGVSYVVTNYGDVVGNTSHGKIAQKRIDVGEEILQGHEIEIKDGYIYVDDMDTGYPDTWAIGSVYEVIVHTVNGDPTVIEYDETDTIGSENVITYWVNGKDTGVSASTRVTKTILMENGTTASCNTIGSMEVNGVLHYILDGELTDYVISNNDVVRDSYEIIDPAFQNKYFVNTISTARVVRDGEEIINTNVLGQKAIGTITKNGTTISGELSFAKVYVITYNNKTYVAKSVIAKDGFLCFDGINSNIPYNDASIVTERKKCYVVNGELTSVEYSENDNISYKAYYTSNGTLTNYEVLGTDEIINTTTEIKESNIEIANTYTVVTSNGTIDGKALTIVTGKKITTQSGNELFYYNSKATKVDEYIYKNGVNLGKKSNAEFYTVERNEVAGKNIFSINSENEISNIGEAVSPYYLPKIGWYLFVNGGKIYRLNGDTPELVSLGSYSYNDYDVYKVDGTGAVFAPKDKSKSFIYSFSYNQWSNGELGPADVVMGTLKQQQCRQYPYSYINDISIYLPAISVEGSKISHCIWCFNSTSPGHFISEDGYSGGQSAAIGVRSDGVIRCGEGHLSTSFSPSNLPEWDEVCAVGPNKYNNYPIFILRKKDNSIYLAKGIGGYHSWKIVNVSGVTGKQLISDKNGTAYVLSVDGSTIKKITVTNVNVKDISEPTFSLSSIDTDGVKSKIQYVNGMIYGIDNSGHLYGCRDTDGKMELINGINNVTDIGSCGRRLLAVAEIPGGLIYVPVVKINGKVYDQSEISIQTDTVYVIDGRETIIKANNADIETDVTFYNITTDDNKIKSVDGTTVNSVSLVSIANTNDGGVVAYITGSTGTKYIVNGIETSVDFNEKDSMAISSKKTYYIGDIDTGIESSGDDVINIDGDYWTINGHNTEVKSFGLGEMCVKISDVTPGEIGEDDESVGSTVVVPLVVRAHIVRFDDDKPITSIKLQYRKLSDDNWTNLKELTNAKRKLETNNMQAIFGRYVNVPVSKSESFLVRVNISDGTTSTVTASSLQPEAGNVFYYSFIRSTKDRLK